MLKRFDYSQQNKKVKLDVRDEKILDILSENSKTPISNIAKNLSSSRETITYRINRLKEKGIIQKYYPKLDFKKLGFNTYHLFLSIIDLKERELFLSDLINYPNVVSILEYSDKYDLEIVFLEKNVQRMDLQFSQILEKYSKIILGSEKLLEINKYNSILFAYYLNKSPIFDTNTIDYVPDETDLKLLSILSNDASQSTYQIATQMGSSSDTISRKIKNLLDKKIILKFSFVPNLSLLNFGWYTLGIKLNSFNNATENKFKSYVKSHPLIKEAIKTFGTWDLMIYAITTNRSDFHQLSKDIKQEFKSMIKTNETFVAYKEHYFNPFPKILIDID